LVTTAASENNKVLLFVSTSDRKRKGELPILGADMQDIWREQIEPILPGNVTVSYGGSPVRKVYEELTQANDSGSQNTYTVYSDPVDTANNYSEAYRQKNFPDLYNSGKVIFAAEANPESFTRGQGTPDVSGTSVREFISCGDFDSFEKSMPGAMDARAVYNKLCPIRPKNEAYLRAFISEVIKG
jgi:hypothetical protein